MITRNRVVKLLNLPLAATTMILATASHAFANVLPGPAAVVSMFSLVIVMAVLTFAGGGYGVFTRLAEVKYSSRENRILMTILKFIGGIILFIFGYLSNIFGILGLSIYTIARGVKMQKWAREAEKEDRRPSHLEGADPKRLKIAGVLLIVLTFPVVGYAIYNIKDVMGLTFYYRREDARALNRAALNAYTHAYAYFQDNPKAGVAPCPDPSYLPWPDVTCFSDMTTTSGSIRLTAPERLKLKKPVAVITFSRELTEAEP